MQRETYIVYLKTLSGEVTRTVRSKDGTFTQKLLTAIAKGESCVGSRKIWLSRSRALATRHSDPSSLRRIAAEMAVLSHLISFFVSLSLSLSVSLCLSLSLSVSLCLSPVSYTHLTLPTKRIV